RARATLSSNRFSRLYRHAPTRRSASREGTAVLRAKKQTGSLTFIRGYTRAVRKASKNRRRRTKSRKFPGPRRLREPEVFLNAAQFLLHGRQALVKHGHRFLLRFRR